MSTRRRPRRAARLLLLLVLQAAARKHVEDDDALVTPAPTPNREGPLEPCVERIEYHKVVMTKTLLSVSFGAFLLGCCCCSICGLLTWCGAARFYLGRRLPPLRRERHRKRSSSTRVEEARFRSRFERSNQLGCDFAQAGLLRCCLDARRGRPPATECFQTPGASPRASR